MNGFEMVGDYVHHILKKLFIVVDQGTWSCVQWVTIPSDQLWNAHHVMHELMFRTRSGCPAGKRHVRSDCLERAVSMFHTHDHPTSMLS